MADIGKDGSNLFQSIFHRAPDVSPSADCLNINNEDDSTNKNVNKHVDEEDRHCTNNDENGIPPVSGEPNSSLKEIQSIDSDVADSEIVSNGCSVQEDPLQTVINNVASEDQSVQQHLSENGSLYESTSDASSVNVSSLKLEGNRAKCGKNKRGIRFPSDNFISGYHDPPDPWKDAPAWTSEDLVAAYKKSCDINATKPSAKIVQQLQSINPTRGKREEVLTLKGEKLDQRQCETIEEILRRVQFKLLDVEACHLDDECAQALFDMIEYYESACQLNISFNKNISVRGWQACARLVRRTPSLKYLDMRGCELNDRTIPLFGRALKLGCHLTVLHMENMALAGRTLVILVAALKMNETLQELFLAENKLMPSDGVQLGNLMRYNHYLGLLDLRNNHLQDVGVSHICEGLLEQGGGRGLRTLVLWNNQINYQAMPALGKSLALSETIETLNIGHNAITNEGAHLLKDGLLKTNSLLRLGLQGTRISDEGAVALAEYIADSTILLRVDLRDNDIKTGGLMALSHAMRVNTSVTRIDLDKDPKKESYMKDYAEQQGRLLRDILTFQQRNIEAALAQEEEERAELERKAKAISASNQGDTEAEGNVDNPDREECETRPEKDSAVQSSNNQNISEDFTIIERSEAVGDNGARAESSDLSQQNSVNDSKKILPSHLRPSHLFHQMPSCAQESLDSPLPSSAGREKSEEELQSLLCSNNPQADPLQARLPISQEAPPAEMILSPQYVPRNMARKIFSVSRVNEEAQLSGSPQATAGVTWDPLNASTIPVELSPCPTTLTQPIIVPPISLTPEFSHISTESADSPSTTLAQSLALAAMSESLPILSDAPSTQVVATTKSSATSSMSLQQALTESVGMEPSSELSTAVHNETLSFQEKMLNVNEEKNTAPFLTEGNNINSSSSGGSISQRLECCDKNSTSSLSALQVSKEEQNSADLLHQEETSLLATEVAEKVHIESSQACEPSLLSVSPIFESAPMQGSGDGGSQVKRELITSAATESLGDGDNGRIEEKDTDPFIKFSCDIQSEPSSQQLVVEINSDSPAVLNSASSDNYQESCEAAKSSDTLPSPEELGDDEDSWLAVGEEEAEGKISHPMPQQPDFFTTLSMNGLTQELASALTSLDGSPCSSLDAPAATVEEHLG
ncbi:hypothetical protein RRG08_042624 [Elysia crispata]|uniref:Protein phosphatase 1 regulatory subunit 37 n=1 Tax=Elysia crispata TaxID=231223 RepID=A0AAE1CKN5_9GAST|nr:hypothetical protein RRG08_042624 [Elysia crispata]